MLEIFLYIYTACCMYIYKRQLTKAFKYIIPFSLSVCVCVCVCVCICVYMCIDAYIYACLY